MICDRCGQPVTHGEHGLFLCPFIPRHVAPTIWPDDIPGGIDLAHGLCHADGTPKRYWSRAAIREEAHARGLIEWGEVYEESRMTDARVRDDWQQSGEAQRAQRDRDDQRRERRR